MKLFLSFTKEYEEKVDEEERGSLFHSRLERIEWRLQKIKTAAELFAIFNGGQKESVKDRICCNFVVFEEMYGFATGFYGTCKRKRKRYSFQIAPKMIPACIRKSVHKALAQIHLQ